MESHVDNNKKETKQDQVLHDVVINVGVEPALDESNPDLEEGEIVEGLSNVVSPVADPNVAMMQPRVDDKGKAAVVVNVELSNEGNPNGELGGLVEGLTNVVSPVVDPNVGFIQDMVGSEQAPNVDLNGLKSSSLNHKVNVNLFLGQVPSHSCKFCNKTFPTSQALGGHQNAHKHERENSKKRKAGEMDLGRNGSYPPRPPITYGYNPNTLHQSPYFSSLFNRSSSFGFGMNSYAHRPPFHGVNDPRFGSTFGYFSGSRAPAIPHNFVPPQPQQAFPSGFTNFGAFRAIPSGVGGSSTGSNINVARPFGFFGNGFNHGGGYVSEPPRLLGTTGSNFLSLGRGSASGSASGSGSGLGLGVGPGSGSGLGSRSGSGEGNEGPGDKLNLELKL